MSDDSNDEMYEEELDLSPEEISNALKNVINDIKKNVDETPSVLEQLIDECLEQPMIKNYVRESKLFDVLFELLDTHPEDIDLISSILEFFYCMTLSNSGNLKVLFDKNPNMFIDYMKKFKDKLEIVGNCIGCIWNGALTNDYRKVLHKLKVEEVLVSACNDFIEEQNVLTHAFGALLAFSLDDLVMKDLVNLNVLELAKKALEITDINDNLFLYVSGILVNMVSEQELREKITKLNIIPNLIKIIGNFIDDESVIKRGLSLLKGLAINIEQNQKAIIDNNGAELLINILNNHFDNIPLMIQCFGVVVNTALCEGTHKKLVESGIIKLITQTLTKEFNADLSLAGINALINISTTDELEEDIGNEGGCELIVFIMSNAMDNDNLIKKTLNAMRCLTVTSDSNKNIFCYNGGLTQISQILSYYKNDNEITRSCINAIMSMASNEETLPEIRKSNIILVINELMNVNINDLTFVITSLRSLQNICFSRDCAMDLIRNEGFKAMINISKVYPNDIDVAKRIISLCIALNQNEGVIDSFIENLEIIKTIVELSNTCIENVEVINLSMGFVQNFVSPDEIPQKIIRESGYLQLIANILVKYPDNQDIVLKCMIALIGVSTNPANMTYLLEINALNSCDGLFTTMIKEKQIIDIVIALYVNLSLTQNNEEKIKFISSNALPNLSKYFKDLPEDMNLYLNVTRVLSNICNVDEAKKRIIECDSLELLLAPFRKHPDNANIALRIMRMISELSRYREGGLNYLKKHFTELDGLMRKNFGNEAKYTKVLDQLKGVFK